MTLDNLITISQLHEFLSGTDRVDFALSMSKDEKYEAINKLLSRFDYPRLHRSDKGIMIAFLQKVSGYSRQNITLMINRYRTTGKLERYHQTCKGFKTVYTKADKRLLAQLDQRHDTPNGLMVKKLCYRAYHQFNRPSAKVTDNGLDKLN